MKVILLEDVYKQGVAGDIVDVAPGYARNYLIPRELAVKATPYMIEQFQQLSEQAEMRRAEREKEYQAIAEKIEELTLYFPVRASESGKLYGSVTTEQIAEALKEEIGLEIDRRRIGDGSLRELGEVDVVVRLDAGLTPTVNVVVHREDVDPHAAEEPDVEAMEAELLAEDTDYAADYAAEAEEITEGEEPQEAEPMEPLGVAEIMEAVTGEPVDEGYEGYDPDDIPPASEYDYDEDTK